MSAALPVVVMGVAGCGKSTIGELLARRLGLEYAEADVFHPPANVAKMADGRPLDDEDRLPWLAAIGDHLRARAGTGVVVSCSALKRGYRDRLRAAAPRAWFVHLVLDEATAAGRVAARPGHFMPASLVASQFAALEPLDNEAGVAVDATQTPALIVASVLAALPPAGEEDDVPTSNIPA
ncbi:gluconokinase [Actinoplanes sp. NPDC049668]|uniref:gluconokinase n=1 Tax=unclassified Actinoplanes TaxID=2626549 RepID=UPI0033B044CE